MLQALKSRLLKGNKSIGEVGSSEGKIKCENFGAFGSHIPCGIFGCVRIVFLSDIHCKQYKVGFGVDVTQPNTLTQEEKLDISIKNLPNGDILIISGDFVETGLLEEITWFSTFLKEIVKRNKFKHIVFICGNHERTIDIDFYEANGWRYHKIRQDVKQCREALFNELPANVHYLFDNYVVLEGMKIYGTPWVVGGETYSSSDSGADTDTDTSSTRHFRWAYSLTEEELVAKFAQIPDDTDILITHMPPFGIGDGRRNYEKDYFDEQEHQVLGYDHEGSTSLTARLVGLSLHPLLHCYGHIHSGYGAYRPSPPYPRRSQSQLKSQSQTQRGRADTLFVNAANCDEDYVPIQPALVVDLSPSSPLAPASVSEVTNSATTQHYFKLKLDTAIAILVAIDKFSCSHDHHADTDTDADKCACTTLKTAGRSYLQQVLAHHSITTDTSTPASAKHKRQKELQAAAVASAVTALEAEITQLFAQHSLLESLYAARLSSRGGMEESVDDFRSMQLVVPHLYIGSVYPSECKDTLEAVGITHICNCCHGWEPSFPGEFTYMTVPVEDVDTEDLSEYFIDCIAFIDVAINIDSTSKSTSHHEDDNNTNTNNTNNTNNSGNISDTNNSGNISNNNVYIHCQLGISRSATIVIAYLMFTLRLPYRAANALLRRARPFVCPNQGFVDQLLRFEVSLRL